MTQQMGGFISGLKDGIRAEVQASRPTTLIAAKGLACLYEAKHEAKHNTQRRTPAFSNERRGSQSSRYLPLPSANLTRGRTPAIKRLSPAELADRRAKGLCFNCDEKFSPGHRCKKLFLIEGIYEEEDQLDREGGYDPLAYIEEGIPGISLHTISGM